MNSPEVFFKGISSALTSIHEKPRLFHVFIDTDSLWTSAKVGNVNLTCIWVTLTLVVSVFELLYLDLFGCVQFWLCAMFI